MQRSTQYLVTPVLMACLLTGAVPAATAATTGTSKPGTPPAGPSTPAAGRTAGGPGAPAPPVPPSGSGPATSAATNAELHAGGVSPEAAALLAAVGESYANCTSYEFEGTSSMTMTAQGREQTMDVPFRLAAVKPSKMRTEILNPMMSYVNVSDGAQTWVFVPQARQYTRKTAAPISPAGSSNTQVGSMLASGTPIQRYLSPSDGLLAARTLGEATLDVAGRPVRCTVLELLYTTPESLRVAMSPTTVWVDPATHMVVRDSVQISMREAANAGTRVATVTTYRVARMNQPVADTVFTFVPPSDSRLVEQIGVPGMTEQASPLVGKPALEIALNDLTGKPRRLSALRGKVVLLDFWATWCGPCRREMPTIVKLHRELTSKGLAVVAVNVGEGATTVSGFLTKNGYSLPVWLDHDTEVAGRYGASAIPTLVVIDRKGTVITHTVGLHDEASLRDMLKKAGL